MTWTLPNLDPLWVSVGVTVVLVIITGIYAWQTWKIADLSRFSFLYQRKPQFSVFISGEPLNKITLTFSNNKLSVSSVKNINAELFLRFADNDFHFGTYVIKGPLFPGEQEIQDITDLLRSVMINRKLMATHTIEWPVQDNFGNYSYDREDIYTILKGKIEFDIIIKINFEINIEYMKQNKFNIERLFNVVFEIPDTPYDEPPPDYEYEDNYETNIRMKTGIWIRSPDYVDDKNVKNNGVKGLN